MNKQTWKFNLDAAGIDSCVETIQETAGTYLGNSAQGTTLAFSFEIVLLNLQKHFGMQEAFELEFIERFGKANFYIRLKGESYDPRISAQTEEDEDEFSSIILNRYSENAAEYKYEKGTNIISRGLKKKKVISSSLRMLIGFVLGVIFGFIGQTMPTDVLGSISVLFDTVNGIILDLVVMGATLVVFLMVANSISGFESLATVKKTGSCIIKKYLLSYLLGVIIFIVYILLFFDFDISSNVNAGTVILSLFTETIADIFPQSPISPFLDCNFLQIIFLAMLVGVAMLVIGDSTKPVREFFKGFETIANQILDWFCGLLPIYIFTMVPSLIWGGQLSEMAAAFMQLIGITLAATVLFSIRFFFMCGKLKISPLKALNNMKSAILKGLMTGASTVAITEIQDDIRAFKIKESFNSFATAIGLIFDVIHHFLGFAVLTFYLMVISDISISISTIISITIICLLLSIAAPPVNGGAIAVELIIAGMMNVPETYLAIVPPIMLIFDFIATGFRCGGIVVSSAASAKEMGEIEE